MKCIAVDDEPFGLKLLEDNISKVPFLELVAACTNAFEAMAVLEKNKIDLIFIDIQMPGLSGMEFIASMEQKPLVIFVTAYKQYALDSYDLSVVDYLVKPVSLERFIKACNRAKEIYELKSQKHHATFQKPADYFFVNVDYSQLKVMFNDIIWMEGLRDYVKIYLKSKNHPLLIRSSLKALEPELPAHEFIRFHKSYLASIDSITSVRKNSILIKDIELPIGETYKEGVERMINKKN